MSASSPRTFAHDSAEEDHISLFGFASGTDKENERHSERARSEHEMAPPTRHQQMKSGDFKSLAYIYDSDSETLGIARGPDQSLYEAKTKVKRKKLSKARDSDSDEVGLGLFSSDDSSAQKSSRQTRQSKKNGATSMDHEQPKVKSLSKKEMMELTRETDRLSRAVIVSIPVRVRQSLDLAEFIRQHLKTGPKFIKCDAEKGQEVNGQVITVSELAPNENPTADSLHPAAERAEHGTMLSEKARGKQVAPIVSNVPRLPFIAQLALSDGSDIELEIVEKTSPPRSAPLKTLSKASKILHPIKLKSEMTPEELNAYLSHQIQERAIQERKRFEEQAEAQGLEISKMTGVSEEARQKELAKMDVEWMLKRREEKPKSKEESEILSEDEFFSEEDADDSVVEGSENGEEHGEAGANPYIENMAEEATEEESATASGNTSSDESSLSDDNAEVVRRDVSVKHRRIVASSDEEPDNIEGEDVPDTLDRLVEEIHESPSTSNIVSRSLSTQACISVTQNVSNATMVDMVDGMAPILPSSITDTLDRLAEDVSSAPLTAVIPTTQVETEAEDAKVYIDKKPRLPFQEHGLSESPLLTREQNTIGEVTEGVFDAVMEPTQVWEPETGPFASESLLQLVATNDHIDTNDVDSEHSFGNVNEETLIELPPLTQESIFPSSPIHTSQSALEPNEAKRKSRKLVKRREALGTESDKQQRGYFEMEAELSEDEYAGLAGLDEDEDAVDDGLAMEDLGLEQDDLGIIDMDDIQEYHRKHVEAQDASDIKTLLRDLAAGNLGKRGRNNGLEKGYGVDYLDEEEQLAWERRLLVKRQKLEQTLEKLAENPETVAFAKIAMGIDDMDEDANYCISDVEKDELIPIPSYRTSTTSSAISNSMSVSVTQAPANAANVVISNSFSYASKTVIKTTTNPNASKTSVRTSGIATMLSRQQLQSIKPMRYSEEISGAQKSSAVGFQVKKKTVPENKKDSGFVIKKGSGRTTKAFSSAASKPPKLRST